MMKKIPDYGDHMLLEDFIDAVEMGAFMDYDGHGRYATETEISDIIIIPSDVASNKIKEGFTHMVWFNK